LPDPVDESAGRGRGREDLFGRDKVARVPALELPLGGPDDAHVAIAALAATYRMTFLEIWTSELGAGWSWFRFAHL
jgi:hypothetical protein